MLSIDTNILLYATSKVAPGYAAANDWLQSISRDNDVAISEFALTELFRLLRNPKVTPRPLTAGEAVAVINNFRSHPHWRLVGFSANSRDLHDRLWQLAAAEDFAYRRIYDARLALTLQAHGVTRFATANEKDFTGLGFAKVWNPIA